MAAPFTHTILRACSSPDDEEDMGAIDESAALELISTFPFADELAKRDKNPELTVPTLTFTRSADSCYLVVWSETPGRFVLFCPTDQWLVEGATDMQDVLKCASLYFAGDDESLASQFSALVRKYRVDSSGSVVLPSHQPPNTSLPPG